MHELGRPFIFLDLRALKQDRRLYGLPMRAPKFDINVVAAPADLYDGIFFIDRMAAATRA